MVSTLRVCSRLLVALAYTNLFVQKWSGHVKARHFVLGLRDYYQQQVDRKRQVTHGDAAVSCVADQDEWALEWIDIDRLQAIVEAFDDDASGLITVAEANHFTASRPKEWRYVRVIRGRYRSRILRLS